MHQILWGCLLIKFRVSRCWEWNSQSQTILDHFNIHVPKRRKQSNYKFHLNFKPSKPNISSNNLISISKISFVYYIMLLVFYLIFLESSTITDICQFIQMDSSKKQSKKNISSQLFSTLKSASMGQLTFPLIQARLALCRILKNSWFR